MAKSRSRGARQSKATSKKKEKPAPKAAPATEVEVVEESGGPGVETGIAIFTFIALLVAFVLVDRLLGVQYEEGLFFKP